MSMPQPRYFTTEDVRAMPDDGNRYEVVGGELLVTPAPRGHHQLVVTRLSAIIQPYLLARGLEQFLSVAADVSFDERTLVQPDLFVADLAAFIRSGDWADIRKIYLIAEIVSPSSGFADRITKRRAYQENRVGEYWVVDIEMRQVEVWTPEAASPRVERHQLRWTHPSLTDECAIDLDRLFDFGCLRGDSV